MYRMFVILLVLLGQACRGGLQRRQGEPSEYPDGYFPFEESPSRTPPKVRRPPYAQADVDCPGMDAPAPGAGGVQSLDNLCGDLNKGYIPKSPLGRNVNGHSYPFSTLPILKADKNLPKLAKYEDFDVVERSDQQMWKTKKSKRSTEESVAQDTVEPEKPPQDLRRQGRGLCDRNYGMSQIGEDPLTPCPSAAEYVTPVYAKNYQGVWRYVVQIPYEGYFTQTVEVTKCLKKKCHFMDGSCLASPRWVSLLVAELFYPHARFPATKPGASYRSMSKSQSPSAGLKNLIPPLMVPDLPPYIPRTLPFTQKEAEEKVAETKEEVNEEESDQSGRGQRQIVADASAAKPTYCDGVDEIGCYQVRLYYDWLLVPGSCKCW
nr:EOG090X06KU [Ceriodaphnia reticulata]